MLSASPPGLPAAAIGSVTKAMNLDRVLSVVNSGKISLDDCVTLTTDVLNGLGDGLSYCAKTGRIGKIVDGQVVGLQAGDEITLRTLLLMSIMRSDGLGTISSALHAARAEFDDPNNPTLSFAELIGASSSQTGSTTTQGKWVQLMQQRAIDLELTDTLYCDPEGRAFSTPQDQIKFWMNAFLDPNFVDITTKLSFTAADVAAEQAKCSENGVELAIAGVPQVFNPFTKIGDSAETYPGFRGSKGGSAGTNFGMDYVGSQLQCNIASSASRACIRCLDNHAERLERPLFVAQSQSAARGNNAMSLLDYGYQLTFTPDRLADNVGQERTVGDFGIASLDPVLNVSASIVGNQTLEVCLWNASATDVALFQCVQRTYQGFQPGAGESVPETKIDMVDVTSVGADADYLTAFKSNGKLRLDLWRVGPRPEGIIPQ